jgi:glycosyltransferase involved in cell wall biosynthesis
VAGTARTTGQNGSASRPAGKAPLVAAALIVRDEEANLPLCLDSLDGVVDQFVVVDTGSVDRTREIALARGATVLDFPWSDDFAAARNSGLPHVRATFTLIVDAADRLRDGEALRDFLGSPEARDLRAAAILVESRVRQDVESFWQPRLFRSSAGIRYERPVHATPRLDGFEVVAIPGRIEHRGYEDEDKLVAKCRRTLRILASNLPDGDPFRLYSELRAYATLRDFPAVVERSERLLAVDAEQPAEFWLLRTQALLALGEAVAARDSAVRGLQEHPGSLDLQYALLLVAGTGYVGAALSRR